MAAFNQLKEQLESTLRPEAFEMLSGETLKALREWWDERLDQLAFDETRHDLQLALETYSQMGLQKVQIVIQDEDGQPVLLPGELGTPALDIVTPDLLEGGPLKECTLPHVTPERARLWTKILSHSLRMGVNGHVIPYRHEAGVTLLSADTLSLPVPCSMQFGCVSPEPNKGVLLSQLLEPISRPLPH